MASKVIENCIEKQGIKRDNDVKELYLAKCNISQAPDLSRFKNLQRLWLKDNKLHLMQGLRSNFQLTELYLQNNMLTEINGALVHLTCLQVLFLHGNQLTVLSDVIHELRNMRNLKNLNLFGNPVSQECDYRMFVIHSIKSLQLLDRQAVNREEREKSQKKYEIVKQNIKDTIVFGRRRTAETTEQADAAYFSNTAASCLRNTAPTKYSAVKQVKYNDKDSICYNEDPGSKDASQVTDSQLDQQYQKGEHKRSLMQFNTFGWTDVLDARSKSKDSNPTPSIYTTKFR